jgi:hypothetical protein
MKIALHDLLDRAVPSLAESVPQAARPAAASAKGREHWRGRAAKAGASSLPGD